VNATTVSDTGFSSLMSTTLPKQITPLANCHLFKHLKHRQTKIATPICVWSNKSDGNPQGQYNLSVDWPRQPTKQGPCYLSRLVLHLRQSSRVSQSAARDFYLLAYSFKFKVSDHRPPGFLRGNAEQHPSNPNCL